jgi:hypothetical protein
LVRAVAPSATFPPARPGTPPPHDHAACTPWCAGPVAEHPVIPSPKHFLCVCSCFWSLTFVRRPMTFRSAELPVRPIRGPDPSFPPASTSQRPPRYEVDKAQTRDIVSRFAENVRRTG